MAETRGRAGGPLLAVAILSSFVAFLDGSVVNLALPAIGRQFGGGLALQQWVIDGYLLALGALILVAGAVSDSFGRLAVLRTGLAVFGLASLGCALASTGGVLVGARFLQGVGAAFLVPSSLAMINARYSGAEQAKAIGTWTAYTGTAFVIGPLLGGVLVDALSWRWIFGVNVVPLVVTLYLSTRLSADGFGPVRRTKIDVVGALLAAIGLSGTVYALIEQQRFGWANPAVLTPLLVGVVCLAAFPWWENRTPNPMMPLHIFAARNFAIGNVATVFLYAAVSLGTLMVALFLQETAGLSATAAGVATLPIPVLSFLLARMFGTLAGRHGPRLYMALGPLIAAAGFVLMAAVGRPFDFWTQLLPGLVVFGLGLTMTVSPLTAAVLAAVDPAQSGIGSAINNAIARIAGLIAVALVGVICGGAVDFDGFRQGAYVVAALFVVAGAVSWLGIRNDQCDYARISTGVTASADAAAVPAVPPRPPRRPQRAVRHRPPAARRPEER